MAAHSHNPNPAVSAEQYRLAQAVLSGTVRTPTGMTKKVAREIVDRTPARLRSEYSRYTTNPGGEVELGGGKHFLPMSTEGAAKKMARLLEAEGATAKAEKRGGQWGVIHQHANPFYGMDLDLETTMAPAWKYYDSKKARDMDARLKEGAGKKVVLGYSFFGFKEGGGKKYRMRLADHRGNPLLKRLLTRDRYMVLDEDNLPVHTGRDLTKTEALQIAKEARATGDKRVHLVKSNPQPAADDMYASFHGEQPDEVIEYENEEHYHSHLAALGELVELKVKLVNGGRAVIGFDHVGEEGTVENPKHNPFWPFNSFTRTTIYHVGTGEKYKAAGTFKGYTLYRKLDTDEFLVPALDKESRFDTLKDAKAFVNSWTKHQKNSKHRGPFHSAGQLLGRGTRAARKPVDQFVGTAGKVGGYLDDELGRAINPGDSEYDWKSKEATDFLDSLSDSKLSRRLDIVYGQQKIAFEEKQKHPSSIITDAMIQNIQEHADAIIAARMRKFDKKRRRSNPAKSGSTGPVYLTSNEDGSQLFIVGGDQSLDLPGLGITGPQAEKELVTIGQVTDVVYHARKKFDGKDEEYDYTHKLSEESHGPLPILIYDRINKSLSLSGGMYHIPRPLVGTSQGITD